MADSIDYIDSITIGGVRKTLRDSVARATANNAVSTATEAARAAAVAEVANNFTELQGDAIRQIVDEYAGSINPTDVKINGTSITSGGAANIPVATASSLGVVKVGTGLVPSPSGSISVNMANTAQITSRSSLPFGADNLDFAVKAALCDGKGAAWSSDEKTAAKARIGLVKGTDYFTPTEISEIQAGAVSASLSAMGSYVTSESDSNGWHIRTWSNGYKELWKKATGRMASTTQAVYISYPFTFTEDPVANVSVGVDGTIATYVEYVNAERSQVGFFIVSTNGSNPYWGLIYVHGK